ncbi:putative amidoligase domain-containing protein [Hazenella coriacea]|uniref:PhiEco32-like amidoligase-type 2 protein n=1 Tax=Hazenella coriacea TaxID=1179467 RepID=A0A4R3L6H9_9BACL|nr:hypothetical protein [Hazenella coriacea]TCS93804.1 phiEco32-like amidoligase-type 2 protein [Hazenella coriacea]
MGAITLPYIELQTEESIRDRIITDDFELASSIRLELLSDGDFADHALVLNDESQVTQVKDRRIRMELLQLHGIPISFTGAVLREYILCVFQTKVIVMYRSKGSKAWLAANKKVKKRFYRIPQAESSKEVRRVQDLAIRACYATGLDYGIVKCGVGTGRKVAIMNILPSMKINREIAEAFIKELDLYQKQIMEAKGSLDKIVLGADPEFIMKSPKGKLLVASKYFPVRGKVGCDAIWLGEDRTQKPIVELRPNPTSDPRLLAVRIYQGLMQASKRMAATPSVWLAGAMPYPGFPIGGHIHFSGVKVNFKLLRALDNYLSFLLVAVEDPKRGAERRPRYGFLGDFRYQPHGGFEYRTPPSWLVSPTLTKGVLVLAKLIAANYPFLKRLPLSELNVQKAYYSGDKLTVTYWITTLWEELKSLDDYQLYKNYLDQLYRYLTSGISWNETRDLRRVWRIYPYQKRKRA